MNDSYLDIIQHIDRMVQYHELQYDHTHANEIDESYLIGRTCDTDRFIYIYA